MSEIEDANKYGNDIPASHFISNQVRKTSNDNGRPKLSRADSKIGWSLEEKQPPYPVFSLGFQGLSALPPYPIPGSGVVQPPYPVENSVQPPYPSEISNQPPYPVPTQNSETPYPVQPAYYPQIVTTPYPVPAAQNVHRSNSIAQPPYPILEPPYPVEKSVETPYPTEISQLHPVKAVAAYPPEHIGLEAILKPEHEERILRNKYIAEEAELLESYSQSRRSSTRKSLGPRFYGNTPILVECPYCLKWVDTSVRNKMDSMSAIKRFLHAL